MVRFSISTVLVTILSTTINLVNCQTPTSTQALPSPGGWPALDVPPPFDPTWSNLIDTTKVPDAPLSKQLSDCPAVDKFCSWTCSKCLGPDDVATCPTVNDWAFTFDDGPTNATSALLDYLDTIKKKVTFLVVGSRVVSYPDIVKRAVQAGHQLGVHTWSHTALTTQTNEQIIAEIKWTERAIQTYGGVTPNIIRPPFGDYDDRVRAIFQQLGYKVVLWELDADDWMLVSNASTFKKEYVTGNFTQWVSNTTATTGHISLEHDIYPQCVAMVPSVFPIVMGKKFNIKTVGECLNRPLYNPLQNSTNASTTTAAAATTTAAAATTTAAAATKTAASSTAAPYRKRQPYSKRYLNARRA